MKTWTNLIVSVDRLQLIVGPPNPACAGSFMGTAGNDGLQDLSITRELKDVPADRPSPLLTVPYALKGAPADPALSGPSSLTVNIPIPFTDDVRLLEI